MYANYGRDEDFEKLKELGVNCSGKIVIMRYGKVGRSTKVSSCLVLDKMTDSLSGVTMKQFLLILSKAFQAVS